VSESGRPTFTTAYDSPTVLATPSETSNLAPFRPSSSTPSSSPFGVNVRAARVGLAIAITITITIIKELCRGPCLRTSLVPPLTFKPGWAALVVSI
jgi:hypothetical protein